MSSALRAFCKENHGSVRQGRQNKSLNIKICHVRPIGGSVFVGILVKSLRQDTAINSTILQKSKSA